MNCMHCGKPSHFKIRKLGGFCYVCKDHALNWLYPVFGNYQGNTGDMTTAKQPALSGKCRTVGVEVEGNWHPDDAFRINQDEMISVKHDGSLRGADALECVSPIMQSDTIRDWYINLHVERMSTYSRAGEHWWFGTDDMSVADINKLLCFCVQHQHDFARFAPPSRAPQSKFDHSGRPLLISWTPRIHASRDGFIKSLYGATSQELMTTKKDRDGKPMPKYRTSKRANDKDVSYSGPIHRAWWLNVHSYFFTGGKAIEVRLKHSSRNPVAGLAWLDMWLSILENIKHMSQKELITVKPLDLAPALASAVLLDNQPEKLSARPAINKSQLTNLWLNSQTYKGAE